MSVEFGKDGIINTTSMVESNGANILLSSVKSYSYTPTTSSNSCMQGWTIDYSGCTVSEKFNAEIDIEFSGFEATTSAGTFAMWFQGSNYNVSKQAWEWTTSSGANNCWYYNGKSIGSTITSIVTSATKGSAHITGSFTLNSNYPGTYSMHHFGLRSDYSNGTGTVTLKNLKIIPSAEYVNGAKTLRVHSDGELNAVEIYEL